MRYARHAWFVLRLVPVMLSAVVGFAVRGRTRPAWNFRFTVVLALMSYCTRLSLKNDDILPRQLTHDGLLQRVRKSRQTIERLAIKPLATIEAETREYDQRRIQHELPTRRHHHHHHHATLKPKQRLDLTVEPVTVHVPRLDDIIIEATHPALTPFAVVDPLQHHDDPPLSAEWVSTSRCKDNDTAVVLYIHGGAYIALSAQSTRGIVANISAELDMRVLSINYRLAPEFPFPCALLDVLSWYVWLVRSGYDPSRIVVMGESAGGGLAVCLLVLLRDYGDKIAAALDLSPQSLKCGAAVCFSPWLDLSMRLPSVRINHGVDYLADPNSVPGRGISPGYLYGAGLRTVDAYAHPAELDRLEKFVTANPYISPARAADLSYGLPPILTQCGGCEILLSDQLALFHAAQPRRLDSGQFRQAHKLQWVTRWTNLITPAHPVFPAAEFVRESGNVLRLGCFNDNCGNVTVEIYRDMVHVLPVFRFVREFFFSMHRMSEWVAGALRDESCKGSLLYIDVGGQLQKVAKQNKF